MRKIDRRVGIPICFIISPIAWLSDLLRSAKKRKPRLRKTLFIELSEMGSAIIADPAMRKLQQAGQAELFFAIFSRNAKSLEILHTIPADNIFLMNGQHFFGLMKDVFRFMAWCRRKKISTVIDLELFSRFTALLAFFSGARSRIGFSNFHDEGLYRGNCINRPVRYNPHVHIAVNFISLTNKALGLFDNPYATIPVTPDELQLTQASVSSESLELVSEKIKDLFPNRRQERIILINPNASDLLPQRRWQPENFAAVSKNLLEKHEDLLVIATGSQAEREYVQQIVGAVGHPRCINSAGYFSFEELIPLYRMSTCLITNDSGPAHFAAVTPLKVFVLFGPETPLLYLPLGNAEPIYLGLPCSPCVSAANHRKTTCITRPCITTISVSIVLEKVEAFLSR